MMEFYSCHKIDKAVKRFWGRCLNIRYVCMYSELCFKVQNLVSVYPKRNKLGQITTQRDLSCGDARLSNGYTLKLGPVQCTILSNLKLNIVKFEI